MKELHSVNKVVENALGAMRRKAERNAVNADGKQAVALNTPFFRKGQRVEAVSGRWKGEVGRIIDIVNMPGDIGLTRYWNPRYTVEFLHGTWETDGRDLKVF